MQKLIDMTTPMIDKRLLLRASAMTPFERRAGRLLRAPDHVASTPAPAAAPAADAPAADAAAPAAAAAAAPDEGETLLGAEPKKPEGGDPESQGEDGKAKQDDAPVLTGAPEKYEFDLGEGVALDQEAFDAVEPVLRELDLNQETAAKLVGAYSEKVIPVLQARAEQQASAAGEELRADWAKSTMADPELGGAKLEESKAMAARAMSHFLPQNEEGQQFRTFLNESGLGNHPTMMRLLARVGRGLGEGTVDTGVSGSRPLSTAEKFYGKDYGQKAG